MSQKSIDIEKVLFSTDFYEGKSNRSNYEVLLFSRMMGT